jgi:hypothetical protein
LTASCGTFNTAWLDGQLGNVDQTVDQAAVANDLQIEKMN